MQQIAREFNFSESTFVFPPEAGHTRKVRIFTPTTEIPFAGYPNIGTAFVLAAAGEFGPLDPAITVTFEEKSGLVPITIQRQAGPLIGCELTAPQRLSLGKATSAQSLARAASLDADDVVTRTHPPQVASVGLPFLLAEFKDRTSLERARINMDGLDALVAEGLTPDLHLYVHSADGFDLRARMFAPLDGVTEDPATGSANCALAGLLSQCSEQTDGSFHWRIAQGVEMGRPSILEARTEKRAGIVEAIRIGGASVLVSEGFIEVD
ncbi:MAG TPA: PhzF family phenazine biosynthesis protein [Thermoanaerobaculia bacterium]|jgi:trans-2,3-dihydro-3-hydroxyanthranilate isomerase|nr:PhzF family phenazine biosynthesis protein [Thermoanaerobaculia bacterium]